jgi:hypothetical protein
MVTKNTIFIALTLILLTGCLDNKCDCSIEDRILTFNEEKLQILNFEEDIWGRMGLSNLKNEKAETFRLLTTPNFIDSTQKTSIVYTLKKIDKEALLTVEHFAAENFPTTPADSVVSVQKYKISNQEWTQFEKLVNNSCFWTMLVDEPRVLDGITWMLEGYTNSTNYCTRKNFHLVVARTHENEGFFDIANKLIDMANSK